MYMLPGHRARHSSDVGHGHGARWVPGWGIPGGYQGCYTGYYPAARKEVLQPAKRARKPCRGWSGGLQGRVRPSLMTTHSGTLQVPTGPASLS